MIMRNLSSWSMPWGASRAISACGLIMLALPSAAAQAETLALGQSSTGQYSTASPSNIRITADQRTRTLTMSKGKSIIVDLPEDCAEVFVGAPLVANAIVRSPRRIYVMAVDKGPTTIFALDKDGRQIATLEINVSGRDIGELEGILHTAMPGNDIHVQMVKDTVILTGSVESAAEAQRAQDIASAFVDYTALGGGSSSSSGSGTSVSIGGTTTVNGNLVNSLVIRGKDQVTLKVMVVEVRRDIMKQLGINATEPGAMPAACRARPKPSIRSTPRRAKPMRR